MVKIRKGLMMRNVFPVMTSSWISHTVIIDPCACVFLQSRVRFYTICYNKYCHEPIISSFIDWLINILQYMMEFVKYFSSLNVACNIACVFHSEYFISECFMCGMKWRGNDEWIMDGLFVWMDEWVYGWIFDVRYQKKSHLFPATTVYHKKYAHGFCFAVLCCGYTLTDFPISIRLTSLALWQSNDCPSASKATLMNMDKYFMWIHYERLHNHNKAKHNKTVCIFLGVYCIQHAVSISTHTYCCYTHGNTHK